jgi:UDP-3-O-[3-hydroxymyristoyl] glucosamine N-acyltransferase
VAGHLTIGKGTIVTAQSGVPNSIPPGALYSGYPAIDNRDWRKSAAIVARLPELRKQVIRLEERLAALEKRLTDKDLA